MKMFSYFSVNGLLYIGVTIPMSSLEQSIKMKIIKKYMYCIRF